MKQILIKQPAGFGDIAFCLKIAKHYIDMGHEVLWPVIKQYEYITDYVYIDGLIFCKLTQFPYNNSVVDIQETDDMIYIPLETAWNKYKSGRILDAKYKLVGLDHDSWQDSFNFMRNINKENQLYRKLGLKDGDFYALKNDKFASPPGTLIYEGIKVNTTNKIINWEYIDGYTIFDWCKVIKNASEIHMVESGVNYIIEKLQLRTDKLYLYPRWGEETKYQLENIFKTKWMWGV